MSKSANQKLKLLYILKILKEETDEDHPISTQDLITRLEHFDVSAERKSIYDDMAQLKDFGYQIELNRSRIGGGYYLAEREFDLPELKLLVDAIEASRFITLKKSRALIKKLEQFVSKTQAMQLSRQVTVANRIKTDNESIYYAVDEIHQAIQENAKISFEYLEWDLNKKLVPRRNGKLYVISPWALTCKDENYYLIAFDSEANKIKHYRVDKMAKVTVQHGNKREGNAEFNRFDLAAYTNQTFSMFGGEETIVSFTAPKSLAGIFIDRFGREIALRSISDDEIQVRVSVAISNQFFGWVTGIGPDIKIVSPEKVVSRYHEYISKINALYEDAK